jgi:AcrR family transcriptional regulator
VTTPPTRPALRERYDRRRSGVIEAAARVFAERGYLATSMADLSAATGLAAGGLYHYIGSKERLLIAICDELLDPVLQRGRTIVADTTQPPADQLRALLRAWLEHVAAHRHHLIVFAQERPVIEREPQWRDVRRSRREFERLLDAVLERGEREGVFHFADRRLALLALLGMVNHTPQWFRPRGRLSPDEIADGYCDLLLGTLASSARI